MPNMPTNLPTYIYSVLILNWKKKTRVTPDIRMSGDP